MSHVTDPLSCGVPRQDPEECRRPVTPLRDVKSGIAGAVGLAAVQPPCSSVILPPCVLTHVTDAEYSSPASLISLG